MCSLILPVVQVVPVHPAAHVQVNSLRPFVHCALFLHGLLAHSLTSVKLSKI